MAPTSSAPSSRVDSIFYHTLWRVVETEHTLSFFSVQIDLKPAIDDGGIDRKLSPPNRVGQGR